MNGTLEKINVDREDLKSIYTKGNGIYQRNFLPNEKKSGADSDLVMLRILLKIIEKESA